MRFFHQVGMTTASRSETGIRDNRRDVFLKIPSGSLTFLNATIITITFLITAAIITAISSIYHSDKMLRQQLECTSLKPHLLLDIL